MLWLWGEWWGRRRRNVLTGFNLQYRCYAKLRGVGPAATRLNRLPPLDADLGNARLVKNGFITKTPSATTLNLLSPPLAGTAWMDLLVGSSVQLKAFRFCAANAIRKKPIKKINKDVPQGGKVSRIKEIREKLKNALGDLKRRDITQEIKRAGKEVLDDDGLALTERDFAEMDLDKLDRFVAEVKRIREAAETDYYFAAKTIVGEETNENA